MRNAPMSCGGRSRSFHHVGANGVMRPESGVLPSRARGADAEGASLGRQVGLDASPTDRAAVYSSQRHLGTVHSTPPRCSSFGWPHIRHLFRAPSSRLRSLRAMVTSMWSWSRGTGARPSRALAARDAPRADCVGLRTCQDARSGPYAVSVLPFPCGPCRSGRERRLGSAIDGAWLR